MFLAEKKHRDGLPKKLFILHRKEAAECDVADVESQYAT